MIFVILCYILYSILLYYTIYCIIILYIILYIYILYKIFVIYIYILYYHNIIEINTKICIIHAGNEYYVSCPK